MNESDALERFVRDGLARGIPRPELEGVLVQAGWSAEHAQGALANYADVDFPIPVPRRSSSPTAREAFMYLVLFSALYMSAFHLGRLLFNFIDIAFPDVTRESLVGPGYDTAFRRREAIRWSASAILVAYPIFLYASKVIARSIRRDPRKRGSTMRRWLTYLTLFLATGILVGDFTTLVYNALGGELAVRFLLKVLVVAAIAGTIFGYYLWDLRRDDAERQP